MSIEEQVLSIEQMNHLKELGLDVKDTALAWYPPCHYDERYHPYYLKDNNPKEWYNIAVYNGEMLAIPTLTLQGILEMLPMRISLDAPIGFYGAMIESVDLFLNVGSGSEAYIEYSEQVWEDRYTHVAFRGNLLEAAYKMLCWVAEKGYLNNKEK